LRELEVTPFAVIAGGGVAPFSPQCEVIEVVNHMIRPLGVTIIAILTFFGASIVAFGAIAFLFVGVVGMSGADAGEPFSVAIAAMGAAGGTSLLILAAATAYVAIGIWSLREWARIVSIATLALGIVATIFSVFSEMGYLGIPAVTLIVFHLAAMAAAVWTLSYLLRRSVKQAFSAANTQRFTGPSELFSVPASGRIAA
jgi:hypothetical protein